jgi:hypothetical protein
MGEIIPFQKTIKNCSENKTIDDLVIVNVSGKLKHINYSANMLFDDENIYPKKIFFRSKYFESDSEKIYDYDVISSIVDLEDDTQMYHNELILNNCGSDYLSSKREYEQKYYFISINFNLIDDCIILKKEYLKEFNNFDQEIIKDYITKIKRCKLLDDKKYNVTIK